MCAGSGANWLVLDITWHFVCADSPGVKVHRPPYSLPTSCLCYISNLCGIREKSFIMVYDAMLYLGTQSYSRWVCGQVAVQPYITVRTVIKGQLHSQPYYSLYMCTWLRIPQHVKKFHVQTQTNNVLVHLSTILASLHGLCLSVPSPLAPTEGKNH